MIERTDDLKKIIKNFASVHGLSEEEAWQGIDALDSAFPTHEEKWRMFEDAMQQDAVKTTIIKRAKIR